MSDATRGVSHAREEMAPLEKRKKLDQLQPRDESLSDEDATVSL